jgi:hypothetical protein
MGAAELFIAGEGFWKRVCSGMVSIHSNCVDPCSFIVFVFALVQTTAFILTETPVYLCDSTYG